MASGTVNDSLHYEWMIMHNEKPIIPQTWTESQPVLALATHYHHQDSWFRSLRGTNEIQ